MSTIVFLQQSVIYESLGIHALAGAVRGHGHRCDVLIEDEESDLIEKLRSLKPDLVAISVLIFQHEWALRTCAAVKKSLPTPVIIGGAYPTLEPQMLSYFDADFLCVGEGEEALVELLDRLTAGRRTDDIAGIHVKANGTLIENPIRTPRTDWDDLPLPDREVYNRYPCLKNLPLKLFITSFGCAYDCSYCYVDRFRKLYRNEGPFYRRKSVQRVLNELKDTRTRFPLTRIHFVDDLFSLNKEWLHEFLPRLHRENGLPWSANVSITHMDETLVRLFKETGCKIVSFGIESGLEKTRNALLNKPISDAVIFQGVKLFKTYGLDYMSSNILRLPGEGLDASIETARFNRKIRTHLARVTLYWPLPHTSLTDSAISKGFLVPDQTQKNPLQLSFGAPLSQHELDAIFVLAHFFHLAARYAWFETLTLWLLRKPHSRLTRCVSFLSVLYYWYTEIRIFNLLNMAGFRYYWHIRNSLINIQHSNKCDIHPLSTSPTVDSATSGDRGRPLR